MIIKIDTKLLDKQIKFMDTYSSLITNEELQSWVDGIANLLSEIQYATLYSKKVQFIKKECK